MSSSGWDTFTYSERDNRAARPLATPLEAICNCLSMHEMRAVTDLGGLRNASCLLPGMHHHLIGDRRMRGTRVLIGMAALLFSGLATVHAQDRQDPSARVARASYLQGDVSFRPGTVDDWTSATLNYPLTIRRPPVDGCRRARRAARWRERDSSRAQRPPSRFSTSMTIICRFA